MERVVRENLVQEKAFFVSRNSKKERKQLFPASNIICMRDPIFCFFSVQMSILPNFVFHRCPIFAVKLECLLHKKTVVLSIKMPFLIVKNGKIVNEEKKFGRIDSCRCQFYQTFTSSF